MPSEVTDFAALYRAEQRLIPNSKFRVVQSLWAHFAMFCMTPSDREQIDACIGDLIERTRMNKCALAASLRSTWAASTRRFGLRLASDLHEYGGLNGKLLTVAEAEALSGVLINGE